MNRTTPTGSHFTLGVGTRSRSRYRRRTHADRACPPIDSLLVEDNPAGVRLVIEAPQTAAVATQLRVARAGAEALVC
jgi:hypothetical protein